MEHGVLKELELRPAQVFAFVSAPIDTVPPSLGSLAHNQLCGVIAWQRHRTPRGITQAAARRSRESAVTSLKCAAARECSLLCQRPLTLLLHLAAWMTTSSAASMMRVTAPTPPRASPSSARGSRGAP